MATTVLLAAVSVDGFVASHDDSVGELLDFYDVGDVEVTPGDPERAFHLDRRSAGWVTEVFSSIGAMVRRGPS